MPKELMKTTPLQPDTRDLPAFYTLSDIQKDAENFVTDGRFLYLWSLNLGNGKTSFAAKIAKTYMAMKCIGNNYRDRVWFEYVPTFLLMSKDFANKDERQEHIKNSMKRELLILDILEQYRIQAMIYLLYPVLLIIGIAMGWQQYSQAIFPQRCLQLI